MASSEPACRRGPGRPRRRLAQSGGSVAGTVVARVAVARVAMARVAIAMVAVAFAVTGCAGSDGDDDAAASTPAAAGSARASGSARPDYTGPAPAPAGEAFYAPPAVLPDGEPGDLLWFREVAPAGRVEALPVTVFQVLYLSTTGLGEPTAVSGTVLVPDGANASTPVLGYAVGTHGIDDSCAPSKAVAAGTDYSLGDLAAAVERGWVVAVTDYEGLGTPGIHTYVVGRAEGHAVLDSVRAATRLPDVGLTPAAPVGLWGYSQGGGAAVWAGELADSYAPDLNLVAVAGGGVPANLTEVSRTLADGASAGLMYLAAVGFDAAYPELDLDRYLTDAGREQIDRLRNGCLDAVALFAGTRTTDVTTVDPLTTPQWQARLSENLLGSDPPEVPLYLYHGTIDTTVAFGQGEALMRAYCEAGAVVTWVTFPGDHGSGIGQQAGALGFLGDRFAGLPSRSTC